MCLVLQKRTHIIGTLPDAKITFGKRNNGLRPGSRPGISSTERLPVTLSKVAEFRVRNCTHAHEINRRREAPVAPRAIRKIFPSRTSRSFASVHVQTQAPSFIVLLNSRCRKSRRCCWQPPTIPYCSGLSTSKPRDCPTRRSTVEK